MRVAASIRAHVVNVHEEKPLGAGNWNSIDSPDLRLFLIAILRHATVY